MLDVSKLFQGLPAGLRDPLFNAYTEISRNYAEHRWEPAELNGGKLCEIVYTIIDGATSGSYATSPQKPSNMVDACRAIERRLPDPNRIGDRSLRILLPRLLPYLYEIRNNRGVGHVGGDVDPNASDASEVFASSNWVMAEMIRIFHNVSIKEAQQTVDALVERKHPIVWQVENTKRVLDPSMTAQDQVLVLLYSSKGWVPEQDLRGWVEYSNQTHFRTRVLGVLHTDRSLEFDREKKRIRLTPKGAKIVEDKLLVKYRP